MTTTPNLALTQYATTDTINWLTQYNSDMTKIDTTAGKLSNLTTTSKTNLVSATNENVTNIGTLASLKTAVKTSTVGAINEVYDTTDNGWISARATLTYASASAPTFVCNTNIDLTTRISVGMKLKLTQTTTKYFFVTAITSTTITLYGGTTYSVINATISNVYFSSVQLPYGFPIASTGLGVDFVIEQGSNANGNYEKWNSGKLVMWGTTLLSSFGISGADVPSIRYGLTNVALPYALFSTSLANPQVSIYIAGYMPFIGRININSTSNLNLGICILGTTTVTVDVKINWYILGTWK